MLLAITGNITCLHIEHFNDGVIDCLGATDERQLCIEMDPLISSNRFLCQNSNICINTADVCSKCNVTNDIAMSFCQAEEWVSFRRCLRGTGNSMITRVLDFLCKLGGYQKSLEPPYLSLISPTFYYFPAQINLGELRVFKYSQTYQSII